MHTFWKDKAMPELTISHQKLQALLMEQLGMIDGADSNMASMLANSSGSYLFMR
jgi:hypothetical protein